MDPKDYKPIMEKITFKWIQTFMERFNIVSRAASGKGSISTAKTVQIRRLVAYHLGEMRGAFDANSLDENLVENIDETHFLINVSNGRTLGFMGGKNLSVAEVVNGSGGMTMVVRINGGQNAMIVPHFIVFKNADRSYPLRNFHDNVPGVSYHTSTKSFVDRAAFAVYFAKQM